MCARYSQVRFAGWGAEYDQWVAKRDVSADLAPLLDLIAFSPEDEDLVAAAADGADARDRQSFASTFEPYLDSFASTFERAVEALFG